MTDSELWLAETMLRLGRDALIPSVESAIGSVWVDDDRAPAPGYYEKRRIPLEHKILRDGRSVAIEFKRNRTNYRVRCGSKSSYEENLDSAIGVIRTLFDWIDASIVTWDEAFSGFVRADSDEWWRILRLPTDATRDEIDRAYKQIALKVHPDAGGTHEAFLRLRSAYEAALSDVG
jgi:hypothetical protein